MGTFTTGHVFSAKEAVTPLAFHQMVDRSYLIGVKNPDFVAGVKLPYITTPGSPATGDVRIGSDGLLEFYYAAAWNDHPADAISLQLTNKSGVDLVLGDVVVPDPANASSFTRATLNPHPVVIGVLAENIANNGTGAVYVRGQCQVRIQPLFSVGFYIAAAGVLLKGPEGTSGTAEKKVAAQICETSNEVRSDAFGILLIDNSGNIGPTSILPCYIWK